MTNLIQKIENIIGNEIKSQRFNQPFEGITTNGDGHNLTYLGKSNWNIDYVNNWSEGIHPTKVGEVIAHKKNKTLEVNCYFGDHEMVLEQLAQRLEKETGYKAIYTKGLPGQLI